MRGDKEWRRPRGLVIDQPGSIAQLCLAVARERTTPVAYVPGLVMRRAADLYPGEAKTDRRDAYVIADTGRTRRKQVHWLDAGSDDLLDQLRVLDGFDVDLAADQTRVANRLRDTLTAVSPALERVLGARLGHAGVRDLLAKHPTPSALRATGRGRRLRAVKGRSPRLAAKVTDAVPAALDAQTVIVPAEATLGRVIAELAGKLDRIHARRDRLAGEIEEVFTAHPFGRLLQTLPGIGPRTGARILAEIGDGSRFATGDRLAAYAGLAPAKRPVRQAPQRRSPVPAGQPPAQERHVPRRLRLASQSDSKAYSDRRRAEGKQHNAAVICLARRRCNVILAMLRTHQPYTPAHRQEPLSGVA